MPTLADIANAVDSTKRRLGLLASDPVTFWRLLNDEARDANRAAVDRAGLLGSVVPQARDAAWQEMTADPAATATNWMGGGLLGKIVYHGSPHKFPPVAENPLGRFDASKIGTGEGAQAYGHGLYFAENPEVAQTYAPRNAKYEGNLMRKYQRALDSQDYDRAQVFEDALLHKSPTQMRSRFTVENGYEPAKIEKYRAIIDKEIEPIYKRNNVGVYKVDLPDEWLPKMLDWDKPLSQQPEAVRKAVEPIVAPIRNEMAKPSSASWGEFSAPQKYDPTGQEVLALLRKHKESMDAQSVLGNGLGPDVSERLRGMGVPGIRYLDGGSRAAGEGTANYVVFPGMEGLLKILSRE